MCTHNLYFEQKEEKYLKFSYDFFVAFTAEKNQCILHGHVFVMPSRIFFFFFFIQFYVPFKLFHSYRDESIGRWGENRSTRGKTT